MYIEVTLKNKNLITEKKNINDFKKQTTIINNTIN